jgi:hypothetical protein
VQADKAEEFGNTSRHASTMGFAHLLYLRIHNLALDPGKSRVSGLVLERRGLDASAAVRRAVQLEQHSADQ